MWSVNPVQIWLFEDFAWTICNEEEALYTFLSWYSLTTIAQLHDLLWLRNEFNWLILKLKGVTDFTFRTWRWSLWVPWLQPILRVASSNARRPEPNLEQIVCLLCHIVSLTPEHEHKLQKEPVSKIVTSYDWPTRPTCQHWVSPVNQTPHLTAQRTPLVSPVLSWWYDKHKWECCLHLKTRYEQHSANQVTTKPTKNDKWKQTFQEITFRSLKRNSC